MEVCLKILIMSLVFVSKHVEDGTLKKKKDHKSYPFFVIKLKLRSKQTI